MNYNCTVAKLQQDCNSDCIVNELFGGPTELVGDHNEKTENTPQGFLWAILEHFGPCRSFDDQCGLDDMFELGLLVGLTILIGLVSSMVLNDSIVLIYLQIERIHWVGLSTLTAK